MGFAPFISNSSRDYKLARLEMSAITNESSVQGIRSENPTMNAWQEVLLIIQKFVLARRTASDSLR